MKRVFMITAIGLCMGVNSAAWSYDATLARQLAQLFSSVSGAEAGDALHFISPETFIKDLQAGKDMVTIDVRTPAETNVLSIALPNNLLIPADQIFAKENLDRIPTDKPVIIVCKSGARATAVGTSLRHIGFDNVYILSGGFQGLSSYYGTKQAYPEAASK